MSTDNNTRLMVAKTIPPMIDNSAEPDEFNTTFFVLKVITMNVVSCFRKRFRGKT